MKNKKDNYVFNHFLLNQHIAQIKFNEANSSNQTLVEQAKPFVDSITETQIKIKMITEKNKRQ